MESPLPLHLFRKHIAMTFFTFRSALAFLCCLLLFVSCHRPRKSAFYCPSFYWGDEAPVKKKSRSESKSMSTVPASSSDMGMADEDIRSGSASTAAGPGMLTAGELNDFSKWELWTDFSSQELKIHQDKWQIKPFDRYTVQVVNAEGKSLSDVPVSLLDSMGNSLWMARTDNTGKAELWAALYGHGDTQQLQIVTEYQGRKLRNLNPLKIQAGINKVVLEAACSTSDVVDAMFVVDATGSMGDEIAFLKEELNDIILKVKDRHSSLKLNVGSVFYRDKGDEYVTKKSDFSENVEQTVSFIKDQYAAGGGDFPEAVNEALDVAVNELSWSNHARARLLFLVLDAPPHEEHEVVENLQRTIAKAAEKGIRIIPITASGIDKNTEYIMRAIALATNGTYVFLTDHSGIGNGHIDPTTDEYDVELLNDLMVRLFDQFLYSACDELVLPAEIRDTTYVYNPRIITHVKLNEWPVKEQLQHVTVIKERLQQDSLASLDSTSREEQVRELQKEDFFSFRYYPNPTQGLLTLDIDGFVKEVAFLDVGGKLLKMVPVNGQQSLQVDLSEFPSGMYFLQYLHDNRMASGKVMILH